MLDLLDQVLGRVTAPSLQGDVAVDREVIVEAHRLMAFEPGKQAWQRRGGLWL
jgi:hypothetical protein